MYLYRPVLQDWSYMGKNFYLFSGRPFYIGTNTHMGHSKLDNCINTYTEMSLAK